MPKKRSSSPTKPVTAADTEWERRWNERLVALEGAFGKSDKLVGHSVIPFEFGADIGGAADIVSFSKHNKGKLYVTAELIGNSDQKRSILGTYELAICHRKEDSWGPNTIGMLAHYTCETPLQPGQTMDIGSATPKGSTITAFLFAEYAKFKVGGKKAGVLLCFGLTPDELEAYQRGNRKELLERLASTGTYPFTDLKRKSVLGKPVRPTPLITRRTAGEKTPADSSKRAVARGSRRPAGSKLSKSRHGTK